MIIARIVTAAVLLLILLAGLFFLPNFWWSLFLLPAILAGAWEWAALAGWGTQGRVSFCALVIALCMGAGYLPAGGVTDVAVFAAAMLFWIIAAPSWITREWRVAQPLVFAVTGCLVLIPTWLALVRLQPAPAALLVLMSIVWVSDTFALIAGKCWGKHKLAPKVSPGKTWEGVAGAMIAVAVYYAALKLSIMPAHVLTAGFTGIFVFLGITVLGIEGDLFESWIKRTAGVKDSGQLLPGHGGVLDRVDALTPAMPFAALMALLIT